MLSLFLKLEQLELERSWRNHFSAICFFSTRPATAISSSAAAWQKSLKVKREL